MEYYAGGELLNKIIQCKNFSEFIVSKIMRQLLSAVSYCHARHIIHRDLKLENLVLETDDIESNLKIIDFDASMICEKLQITDRIIGTVLYF